MYYIYHIAGVKYGCTNNLKRRTKQMKKRYGDDIEVELVATFTDIDEASAKEIELNQCYTTADKRPYSDLAKIHKSITYPTGKDHHNFGIDMEGNKNPNYGNTWTDAQKQHLSDANSNPSESTRKMMSNAWKTREKVYCPHCGLGSINKGNMTRWHFDNCKSI